jgi:hypothetical protein
VDRLTTVKLDPGRVRRLLNIAARWQFLARLADDLSGMTDTRWEPVLSRTRDELVRCVFTFISVLEPAAPELSLARLEFADAGDVYPLQFGIAEAHTIAGNSRQALIASRLLRPLLSSLPAESTTWVDARKLVDRLDFDGRELLSYVRLVDPQRAAEILAEAS